MLASLGSVVSLAVLLLVVFGYYYDKDYYKSSINLLLADKGLVNKILTNISYILEVYDDTKSDVYNDNFDRIRTYNEYQDTGIITLDSTNSKKRIPFFYKNTFIYNYLQTHFVIVINENV